MRKSVEQRSNACYEVISNMSSIAHLDNALRYVDDREPGRDFLAEEQKEKAILYAYLSSLQPDNITREGLDILASTLVDNLLDISPELVARSAIRTAINEKKSPLIKRQEKLGRVLDGMHVAVTLEADNVVARSGHWVRSPDPPVIRAGETINLKVGSWVAPHRTARTAPYHGFVGYSIEGWNRQGYHRISVVDEEGVPQALIVPR